uniref:unspecific monooxygenase n=1 Tax=Zygaena filipendulae TaxID=287375 RepID=D2JLK6_9NEOP|nr:cytochrome P450 CYP6AE27 [Zygaena filipendulae]
MVWMMLLLIVLVVILYYIATFKHDYWKKRGVPYLQPSLVFGNYRDFILMRKNMGEVAESICKEFPDAPVVGTFYGTDPALIVKDPELIKLITTKDFYYFSGRENSDHINKEMFIKNLFFSYGDYWKVVRQNLTSLFSTSKMKTMFYLIEKCTTQMHNLLEIETKTDDILEVKSFITRFTMDCIGSCVFGVETDAMGKDNNRNPFRAISDKIFDFGISRTLKTIGRAMWPGIFYGLGYKLLPDDVESFFDNLLNGVFEQRNHEPTARNDFIDLILKFSKNKCITGDSIKTTKVKDEQTKVSVEVEKDFLVSQCFLFFAAGFETTASTLTFTLYELAKNEKAQKLVIQEVDEYLRQRDGKLEYDCVSQLPYLDACVNEALRLYPVLTILTREVTDDYTLPTGLRLEKKTRIHFPMLYIHKNPEYFPNPEEYRPERHLPGERNNIKACTFFPFGEGPRMCIGMRFAKMMMASCLVTFFRRYRVELAEGMPSTVQLHPRYLGSQSINGVKLKFLKRF